MQFKQSIKAMLLLAVFSTSVLANSQLTEQLQTFVTDNNLPGIETLILKNGELWHHSNVGLEDIQQQTPMQENAIFRIFSMTKPITAVAMLQLLDQGKITLDAYVDDYLPELKTITYNTAKTRISIQQLLTHTSGLDYNFKALHASHSNKDFIQRIATSELKFAPGEKWGYSMASDIQGALIERVSGLPLDQYLQTHIFAPLDMQDTGFWVPEDQQQRLVEDYKKDKTSGKLQAITQSDGKYLKQPGFLSAGGGLVSTAKDYSHFLSMLLNNGRFNGKQIVKAASLANMLRNQTQGLDMGFLPKIYPNSGFGFGLGIKQSERDLRTQGSYYWAGKGGTLFWVDPENKLIVIAMMQAENAWPMLDKWLVRQVYPLITAAKK